MTDLKVVQDWQESGAQVQSALAPFSASRNGRTVEMLGSYATAELDKSSRLGVISIQDEGAALASVSDMRWQTLWISLIAALLTILLSGGAAIGWLFSFLGLAALVVVVVVITFPFKIALLFIPPYAAFYFRCIFLIFSGIEVEAIQ